MTATIDKTATTPKGKKVISLKTLILCFTLAASLVPLSIYGYMSFSEINQKTQDSVNGNLLNSNKSNAQVVKVWVESKEKTMKAIAESDVIKNMDLFGSKNYLIRANEKNPEYYTMNLHDRNGQQVARTTNDKLINVADRSYFKNVVIQGNETYIDAAISRANQKGFMAFAVEVRSPSGEVVGMLSGLSTIDNVTESVTGKKIGVTGISYLVDAATKKILAHPNSKIVGESLTDKDIVKISSDKFDVINDGFNSSNKAVKYTSNPIGKNFVLVSEIDSDEINEPIKEAQTKFLAFITAAILFSVMLSFLLANSIANKINKLSDLATQVSRAKNVEQITNIETKIKKVGGAREIQTIAQALIRLTASIKIAIQSM